MPQLHIAQHAVQIWQQQLRLPGQIILFRNRRALRDGGNRQHIRRAHIQRARLEGRQLRFCILPSHNVDRGNQRGRTPPAVPAEEIHGFALRIPRDAIGPRARREGVSLLRADHRKGQRVKRGITRLGFHGKLALPLRRHGCDRGDHALPRAGFRIANRLKRIHHVLRRQPLSIVKEHACAQHNGISFFRARNAFRQPVFRLIAVGKTHHAFKSKFEQPLHGGGGIRQRVQFSRRRGHTDIQLRRFRHRRRGRCACRPRRKLGPVEGFLTLAARHRRHQECTQAHQDKPFCIFHAFSLPLQHIL